MSVMDEESGHYTDLLSEAGMMRRVVIAEFAVTDPADGRRFVYVRTLLRRYKLTPTAVPAPRDYRDIVVDDEHAEFLRRRGNDLFRAQEYADAAVCYSDAVLMTEPGTAAHAVALANRSAAVFRTGDYRQCVDDVRRAVAAGYPAAAVYKLHERAGDAERMMGRRARARDHYAQCLLAAARPETELARAARRALRLRVTASMDACGDGPAESRPLPAPAAAAASAADARWKSVVLGDERPTGGRHDKVPALSRLLRIGWSPITGRGVYAAFDLNPGDVVAVDEPYVSTSINTCYYSGCLKLSRCSIPCPNCWLAHYCNEECLEKDIQDGHNIECPIIFAIKSLPGNTNLNSLTLKWFLKEWSKLGFEEYCSVVNSMSKTKVNPKTVGFDKNGQFKSDNFLTAYSLRNCENKTSPDLLFFMHCIAVEIVEYLLLSGFKIPDRHVATVGASLVHMLKILDFNCQRILDFNPSVTFTDVSFPIACSLYPSLSLFNHSCDPNVRHTGVLSEKTRVLRAVQPISKGTQLFISYGVLFNNEIKKNRSTYCSKNFKFKCTCQPCLDDWPSGRFIPNRLSSLNIINPEMVDVVSLECTKFQEFMRITKPEDYHKHLNYVFAFNKLIFSNVKRPFLLYENCMAVLNVAQIKNDLPTLSQIAFNSLCLKISSF